MTQIKNIPESRYKVTTGGKIISPSGRHLVPYVGDRAGHMRVDIDVGRKYVHQLVIETFVGPRPEGQEVRHLNGIPTDNRIENLTYGTRSENMKDSVRLGVYRNQNSLKKSCKRGHEFTPGNTYVDPRGCRRCRTCARMREAKAIA